MSGALNRRLSSKSRMPPMPGKILPESLRPASRLNRDSMRSPTTAAALSTMPRMTACFQFMAANEGTDGISTDVAKFGDEHEIEQIILADKTPAGVVKEINFLDEVQQPWNIHQAEERGGNGHDAGVVGLGDKLPHAEAEDEE